MSGWSTKAIDDCKRFAQFENIPTNLLLTLPLGLSAFS